MDRKTIAKYFRHLEEKGLVKLNKEDDNYYLTVCEILPLEKQPYCCS